MYGRQDKGFTLVELMVVVLILGVLVAIAIPTYINSRLTAQKKTCFSNERQIESAFYQYMAAEGEEAVVGVDDWAALLGILVPRHFMETPVCPAGGTYTWTNRKINCAKHGRYPTF